MADIKSAADSDESQTLYPRKTLWLTLVVVLIADALDLIDATITNIAAPTVAADIGGGESLVKWLGAAYALALGSLLVVGGRLGDKYGQRQMLLTGIAGFTLASVLAGLAFDPVTLIVARAVQGAFGALLLPQGIALLTRIFPRETVQKAFGAFGPALGVFAVAGPILAGFLIDADLFGLGWRPMFLVNIVLGGAAFVMAWNVVPNVSRNPDARIDVLGSIYLAGTVFTLLYGLIEGSSEGWTALPIAMFVVAAALGAAFVRRQLSTTQPLLDRRLFRSRGFVSGLGMGLLLFAAFNGVTYMISLFLQLGLGYSPTKAAVGLIPLAVGIIVGAGASIALISVLGRRLVAIGLVVSLAGAAAMFYVVRHSGLDVSGWSLALVVGLIGLGAGLCFSSVFDAALGDIEPDLAGSASGSLSAVQQIANGIGSAAVTSVYFAALSTSQVHAVSLSLVVVFCMSAVSLAAVPLLPRRAASLVH
ncbi:MFS transporter [Nocardioides sp. 1609]|uniref:MFS transporter n=1 Tax=Nocardioides sp. 1609 TaxID=2508327 RepID=UPI001FD64C77|nr:MFS transporter [Nocardioides sp. 1609]